MPPRPAHGAIALRRAGWMVFSTSHVLARRARSAMMRSQPRSARRWKRVRKARRTGACGRWVRRSATRPRPCIASGAPSGCSHTASRPSNSRPIRCLWRRCVTSSGSICRRRSARLCCVSTRNPRCRRSTARSRCCRCGLARPNGARTTTSGTGRSLYRAGNCNALRSHSGAPATSRTGIPTLPRHSPVGVRIRVARLEAAATRAFEIGAHLPFRSFLDHRLDRPAPRAIRRRIPPLSESGNFAFPDTAGALAPKTPIDRIPID